MGPWSTPAAITPPGAGRPNSPIAAAIHDRHGAFQTFYVRPDGAVGSALQVGGHWRSNAITQPGLVHGESPLAIFRLGDGDSRIWVAFFAPDGSLSVMLERPWTDSVMLEKPWKETTDIALNTYVPAGNGTGLVAAGYLRRDEWHAFYQATTGALVDFPGRVSSKYGWGLPLQIAPPGMARPQSPIAVLARGDGQLHVFFVRHDGAVATTWSEWRDGRQQWGAPFTITPPGVARADSALAAVLRGRELHVFYVGPDGALATTWAAGPWQVHWAVGAWQTPFPITPPGAAGPGSRMAAVVRRDQLHVFYQGPDGALATNWAVGPWQRSFPITPPGAGRPSSSIAVVTGR
ncbi:MAG: hypothetical protein QN178_14675 [Armatimonadota bacterium]|nr:hypothetical protein [Armatimonadota bacterium]